MILRDFKVPRHIGNIGNYLRLCLPQPLKNFVLRNLSYPNFRLQQVITYQESELAFLQNLMCFVATKNTKFIDKDKK